jgi:DNA-binding transcriptional regulator YiaG
MTPRDVRRLRDTLRLTQAQLAEKLGTTRQQVTRWENGKHAPGRMSILLLKSLETQLNREELIP